LSPFIHSSPPDNDAPDELQPPSKSSQLDLLLGWLSSFSPRSRLNTSDETEPHLTTPSNSHPDALRVISRLSSFFRSRPHISDELELSQCTMHPHVVEVPAMRDREVCLSLMCQFMVSDGFYARYCLLLRFQKTVHTLSLLVLHQVQDLPIHYPSECWLILYFFSAAHLLNMSMSMHTQHSSRKANCRHMPQGCRHSTRLPPPPCPQHLLLLMLKLPRRVQPAGSFAPFHCGPVSFFFSAVRLPRVQMDTNTTASGHLSHLCTRFFCNYCNLFVYAEHVYLVSQFHQSWVGFTQTKSSNPPCFRGYIPYVLLAHLSLLLHQSRLNTDEEAKPYPTTPLSSRPDPLFSRLSSLFRSQLHTNEEIELTWRPSRPRIVEVAAVRDRQVCLFGAFYNLRGLMISVQTGPKYMKALRAYLQQSQSHAQAQASSLHTQPADASTSATPAPGTPAAQPPPIQWWAQIVLFLCCTSTSYANGH
jgi:hypothetical protein